MLSMWSLLLKYFKLKYLSNHQHYKMIKFGSTTVEVLHCTYLHLMLRAHYLFVDIQNTEIHRNKSERTQHTKPEHTENSHQI
jgi:hypothetical protein